MTHFSKMSCWNGSHVLQVHAMHEAKTHEYESCHVGNKDQMHIPFTFHSSRTWLKKGVKTAHVQASTLDTKRARLAATVTWIVRYFLCFLFLKVKIWSDCKNGPTIAPFHTPCAYRPSKKCLDEWVHEGLMDGAVSSPWKITIPQNVAPLLFCIQMLWSMVEKANCWELKCITFSVVTLTCASQVMLAWASQLKMHC